MKNKLEVIRKIDDTVNSWKQTLTREKTMKQIKTISNEEWSIEKTMIIDGKKWSIETSSNTKDKNTYMMCNILWEEKVIAFVAKSANEASMKILDNVYASIESRITSTHKQCYKVAKMIIAPIIADYQDKECAGDIRRMLISELVIASKQAQWVR